MSPPPTIFSRKSDFLLAQTRLLSQSLSPSRSWRHQNDNSEDGISERAVDDVLFRLNHTLQQHARRVYAPQASRHVAEQIDQLFLDGGDGIIGASKETGAENLYVGLDFCMPYLFLSSSLFPFLHGHLALTHCQSRIRHHKLPTYCLGVEARRRDTSDRSPTVLGARRDASDA